jgi:hypothetical protein
MELYKFRLVLYAGGDNPTDAFQNLINSIESTGVNLEDEVEFERVDMSGMKFNLAKMTPS